MQKSKKGGKSSFDTNWDVDQYRHEWDSDEQWEVRRDFILANKNSFPEDRLVCLAQVYANIEFMECSYNEDVMKQVASMAEGLSTDHRDRKKQAAEVIFVKESNSSGSKRPNSYESPQQSKYQRSNDNNTNRSSASSYFGSNPSGANNYQTQSYYTRDYKSNQEGGGDRNWGSGASAPQGNQIASQQWNWTSGNETLLTLTKKIQNIGKAIESETFNLSQSYFRLIKFAKNEGLTIRHKKILEGKKHCLGLFIGDVLAVVTLTKSKKGIVNAVSKLYEIFKTKSWKLVTDNREKVKLLVTGKKGTDPIPPEPSLDLTPSEETFDSGLITQQLADAVRGFVIVDHCRDENVAVSAITVLYDSARFMRKNLKFQLDTFMESGVKFHRFVVRLQEVIVAEGRDTIEKQAKEAAAKAALSRLRSLVCTLLIKKTVVSDSISRGSVMNKSGTDCDDKVIDKDNRGNKLLRLMGWAGGGLGKEGNKGIAEPLTVRAVCGREGLGLSEDREVSLDFIRKITEVIKNYAASITNLELTFSSDFSKEERMQMHKIAQKFNLKSVSLGKGEDRFLTLKRRFHPDELIRLIIQSGGVMDNYELLPPCGGDAI